MSRKVLEAIVDFRAFPEKYAYGISERTVGAERIVGHGGGFMGINGQLDIYWSSGYTVAVLSNYDPPSAGALAEKIQGLILPE
jgi:hypothetical protein